MRCERQVDLKPLLETQPSYGTAPQATAQLPGGGPTDKGLPLGDDVPGQSTFNKPEDDTREENIEDTSMHRQDRPDSLLKDIDRIDVKDEGDSSPAYMGLGERDPNDYSKTKYPYRDGKPNTHNAGAVFVSQLYKLRTAHVLSITYSARAKFAATAEQILSGLNPDYLDRAQKVSVDLKRADIKNLRWIFNVTGNNSYAVMVKAIRPRSNTTKLSKMNLELSCSCPGWQWLGPEYGAKSKDYMLGKPHGTASTPDIRDPERKNHVCKHVAAVLSFTKGWDIPAAKKTQIQNETQVT